MRVISLFLLLICCASCKFFSADAGNNQQQIDTIINFNKVDASPFFEECKDQIDEARTDCFRTTIHSKIAEKLADFSLEVKDSINEVVTVELTISSKGKIALQEIKSSETIQQELPKLDSLLQISVDELPTIYAASKQGIPVTTQYSLPIKIQLK